MFCAKHATSTALHSDFAHVKRNTISRKHLCWCRSHVNENSCTKVKTIRMKAKWFQRRMLSWHRDKVGCWWPTIFVKLFLLQSKFFLNKPLANRLVTMTNLFTNTFWCNNNIVMQLLSQVWYHVQRVYGKDISRHYDKMFPKLCAAEEAEVCPESFLFWQNLMRQIFLVRVALLWILTFHLNLGSVCAAAKFRMY